MAGNKYAHLPDHTLLQYIQSGHSYAFDELYDRYGQKLFGYFYKMLWNDRELAEDFTQDLFVKLIRNVNSYDPDKTFSTWLYSIANNMCKNEYRSRDIRNKYNEMKVVHVAEEARNPDLDRFKQAVLKATAGMDDDKKALYTLRFMENLTIPQIAEIMNLPEGTVKSRIFYLLKELKEELGHFKNILTYP